MSAKNTTTCVALKNTKTSSARRVCWGVLNIIVMIKMIAGDDRCSREVPVHALEIDCTCRDTGQWIPRYDCNPTSVVRKEYQFCLGGFSSGFQYCINDLANVGTETKCVRETNWEKIVAYTGGFGAVGTTVGGVAGAGIGLVYTGGTGTPIGWQVGATAGGLAGGAIGMVYGYFKYDDCNFVSCTPSKDPRDTTVLTKPARTYSGGVCGF